MVINVKRESQFVKVGTSRKTRIQQIWTKINEDFVEKLKCVKNGQVD